MSINYASILKMTEFDHTIEVIKNALSLLWLVNAGSQKCNQKHVAVTREVS